MGYKINTTWTKIHENDIKKLNSIIDDEYCNELEIGRKLNIMKRFNEEFDKELNSINWDSIIKFMTENNWQWALYDGKGNFRVPTKFEMVNRLRNDFLKHGLYNIIELGKDNYSSFSGGFNFEMGRNGNSFWVHICFDIAHFQCDEI